MLRIPTLVVAALIALAPAGQAAAQARVDPFAGWRQNEAREDAREGRRVSSGQALGAVRAMTRGQGNANDISWDEYRQGYRIRWDFGDGRFRDFFVDGRTGRVSG